MNILEILLAPFLFIIKQLFLLANELTNNYGFSIILLSFGISLILLPIFVLIEKAKRRNDFAKQKMQPQINEIKRCYKGQERYYYIKTLYKQHDYSSLRSLTPVLSLLLQIPFFIAAYQFLVGYAPLVGAKFLFINDLSVPDSLLGRVHILPIVMTLVNLVTVYFYSRFGDSSERKQMVVVAGIFLVLLFNLPSGLVLYWTMNNIFSFFRLFVTNKEVFHKSEKTDFSISIKSFCSINSVIQQIFNNKTLFALLSISIISSQLIKGYYTHHVKVFPHLIIASIISVFATLVFIKIGIFIKNKYSTFTEEKAFNYLFYSLLFLSLYTYMAAIFYYSGTQPYLGLTSIVISIMTQITGVKLFWPSIKNIKLIFIIPIIVILTVILIFQSLNLGAAFNVSICLSALATIRSYVFELELTNFVISGFLFSIIISLLTYKKPQQTIPVSLSNNWLIYFFVVLYITGFIFLWNPLIIYSSFPETFDFKAFDILKNNSILFALSIIILLIFYFVLPKRLKVIWLIISLILITISFIHNSIFPINVGPLVENLYTWENHLAVNLIYFFIEGIFLIVLVFFYYWLFKSSHTKYLVVVLVLLNVILITQSFFLSIKSGNFLAKNSTNSAIPNSSENIHEKGLITIDNCPSISFSKDKKNVVFILADMFHGYSMEEIINQTPQIKKTLSGFIWYPNTLSISTMTSSSIPAMLGGFEYSPDKLNKISDQTIGQKITNATTIFHDKIKAKGFSFTSTSMIYSYIDVNTFNTYLPKWDYRWNKWNAALKIGVSKETKYTLLWNNALFYSAPLFLKSKIYNKGKWLDSSSVSNENTNQAKINNFLRLLPFISDTNNTKPSFIYIHTEASHQPWNTIDDEGVLHTNVSPYDNNKWVLQTLIKWIDWMKVNDVYNNTKIIIISDHGPHSQFGENGYNTYVPFIPNPAITCEKWIALAMNPLLLVKDYQSNDSLKIDWRFLSNADAPAIAFDENDPTKGNPELNRLLFSYHISFIDQVWKEKKFVFENAYAIKDKYFDMTKWTPLIEKNRK